MRQTRTAEFKRTSFSFQEQGLYVCACPEGDSELLTVDEARELHQWLGEVLGVSISRPAPCEVPPVSMPNGPLNPLVATSPVRMDGRISDAESVRNRPTLEQELKAQGMEVWGKEVNIPVQVTKK